MGICINLSFLVLFLQLSCFNLAVVAGGGSIVEFLPGFDGPLPFELETGYIGVGESEEVQLFYYFIKSESNPEKDPILFWLTGGPGCSTFSGLVYEIGPINFEEVRYDGSLPKFVLNNHSWTKVASIIFVDAPVGTGFSYAESTKASHSTDIQACYQDYEFLRKWLVDHPEFIQNPLYVGGDSYSGITVPIVTQLISNGNEAGIEPRINLKGYLLGNPSATPADVNCRVQFAHGMGLISDELYESLKKACKGKYYGVDPSNALCNKNLKTYNQLLDNIDLAHILEPNCPFAAKKPSKLLGGSSSRSLYETFHLKPNKDQRIRSPFRCRIDGYWLSYYWANDKNVQDALHVRKGTIGEWVRCQQGNLNYTRTVTSSIPYHANLSMKGYRSLIYSGDHDMIIPHFGTQDWIRSLNYSIVDDWRQWIFQGQVAGYTRTYENRMTFATVKGGGHTAPEYKPPQCKAMFERWVASQPL